MKSAPRFILFVRAIAAVTLFAMAPPMDAQPLPFRRAIELAISHSGAMGIATADLERAHQAYLESRNTFLPQVMVGSGLAASWGFPLSIEGSAPSIVNLGSQQFLFNAAQREFIRAAKREWTATSILSKDSRNQVILDTALTYSELDKVTTSVSVLHQQEDAASAAERVVADRAREGVDSQLELTKARLTTARARVKTAEAQGSADLLREHLAQLTGLPSDALETVTESMPQLPEVHQDQDLISRAVEASPAIRVADERANAKELRARGEHKAMYPAVDFVGQYGLFSRFNHYDEFFRKFQRHNGTLGVAIRFPFLNFWQKARAQGADAEAVHARKEADGVKAQVSSETLKLQRSVRQLAAAREVARLEHQLAQADVDAAQAKVQAGTATLRDEQNARIAEYERYMAFLDSGFELEKAQMQLLKATGELENWALGSR